MLVLHFQSVQTYVLLNVINKLYLAYYDPFWLALVRVIVKILSRNDLFLIIRGNMFVTLVQRKQLLLF